MAADEVWAAVPAEWWVLCARIGPDRRSRSACCTPRRRSSAERRCRRIDFDFDFDLDVDFEVRGEQSALEDETQFHEHARAMAYPDDAIG